ncbi:hypothetical protein BDZ45DRAFT_749950 [Acephala macrosclerotiorum]|nr:hypothetical protein BDZ45DRAFT_749950 [Acephala macrosclerotiorum]
MALAEANALAYPDFRSSPPLSSESQQRAPRYDCIILYPASAIHSPIRRVASNMPCHLTHLPDGTKFHSCDHHSKSEALTGSRTTATVLDTPLERDISGVYGDAEDHAELRKLKIEHLQLEERMIQGDRDIQEGTFPEMESGHVGSKLSKLKMMGSMGLTGAIASGFQSLDVSIHQIVEHYMSVVVPHALLGLEIAVKEGNNMEIQGYKRALPRVEFEMKQHVQARLDQSKREIVHKCEERALELIELAAADL